jgi:glycolate oxidase iron-sulfur subunit
MSSTNYLKGLDYSVLQQCLHCGMCLPACPTYVSTLRERSSPRGRISLMRAIADDRLPISRTFGEELYFCLGCLACQTACPAGVDYANLFEHARAEVERTGVMRSTRRSLIRWYALRHLFTSPRRLHRLGRFLRWYQKSGLQDFVRRNGLLGLAPKSLRDLEPLTPEICDTFTMELVERTCRTTVPEAPRYTVGLLAGCVQDIAFSDVNADTVQVLQANGCRVLLPERQVCCGSLHAHNGDLKTARRLARINIDAFGAEELDAVIVNAGGCGSHIAHYDRLLADDPAYAERAGEWSRKVKDVHAFLVEIGIRKPDAELGGQVVTYHESCHLKHGQKVSEEPREILAAIAGLELVELKEADWCCGSAGIYNITQPEMSMELLDRKMGHVRDTGAAVVAMANPGCMVQITHGARRCGVEVSVKHPISLLAEAYRLEGEGREAEADNGGRKLDG